MNIQLLTHKLMLCRARLAGIAAGIYEGRRTTQIGQREYEVLTVRASKYRKTLDPKVTLY